MAEIGIITGLVGGLVATGVMTAFMMALGDDSPPPTAALWAKYVGNGPAEDYLAQGMALHFLYGTVAGGVFGLAIALSGITPDLVTVVGGAVLYAVLLTVVGAAFWMRVVLGMEPDRQTAMLFGAFHLVFGVVLGLTAWFVPLD